MFKSLDEKRKVIRELDRDTLNKATLALSHQLDLLQSTYSKTPGEQRISVQYQDQLQTLVLKCLEAVATEDYALVKTLLSNHVAQDPILRLRRSKKLW